MEAPHPRPGGPSGTARHTYYASVSAQRGHRATRTRSSRVMGVLRSPLPSSAGLARPARKRNTRQTLGQDAGRRAHTPTLWAPTASASTECAVEIDTQRRPCRFRIVRSINLPWSSMLDEVTVVTEAPVKFWCDVQIGGMGRCTARQRNEFGSCTAAIFEFLLVVHK